MGIYYDVFTKVKVNYLELQVPTQVKFKGTM